MRNRSAKLVSIAVVGAAAACSSSGGNPAPATQGTVTLSSNATFVNAQSAADVDVEPTYLSFPAATHPDMLDHVPGDVLIGDKGGGKNPWGFLRNVTALPKQQGASIVIQTSPATLQQAVTQATFKATLTTPELTASGPVSTSSTTVHPLGNVGTSGGTTIQLLDFSGTSLLNTTGTATLHSGDTVGYTAHATVTTGTLDFSPSFDIGADIEPSLTNPLSSIQEFHVIATGQLAADLEINTGVALTGNMTGEDLAELIAQEITQSPSTTLASYPIDLGSISLGIISIPVHAQFTATLSCDLSYGGGLGVDVGGKATASVTAGFEYQNSAMSPVFSDSATFTMIGPTWTMDSAVHARCSVKPEFDLSFYDIAAGSVWAEPHVSLDASAVCSSSALTGTVSGSAQAGVDAVASANVDILGLYKWSKTCTLFDVESPTESVSGTFTLPGGSTTACVSSPPPANPAQASPPASCFGGGSGSSSGGSSSGGSSSGGASDDGGSATDSGSSSSDGGTTTASDGGTCDHSACVTGDALSSSCTLDNQGGACIAAICSNDSFCCDFIWDGSCVAHITNGDFGCLASDCP
jgi:uncharacterized membrane protein YgcG